MGRKKKKQLKPWCWYPSVWDGAGAGGWVGEGSGLALPVLWSVASHPILPPGSLLSRDRPFSSSPPSLQFGSVLVLFHFGALSAGIRPGPCPSSYFYSPPRAAWSARSRLPCSRPRPRVWAVKPGQAAASSAGCPCGQARRDCRGRGGSEERPLLTAGKNFNGKNPLLINTVIQEVWQIRLKETFWKHFVGGGESVQIFNCCMKVIISLYPEISVDFFFDLFFTVCVLLGEWLQIYLFSLKCSCPVWNCLIKGFICPLKSSTILCRKTSVLLVLILIHSKFWWKWVSHFVNKDQKINKKCIFVLLRKVHVECLLKY